MAGEQELLVSLKLVADQFTSELKKQQGRLADFLGTTRAELTKLTAIGGIVVGTLTALAKSAANYGDELAKGSEKTGIAVESLSALKFAAQLNHISFDELTMGLKNFSRNMDEARRGIGDGETLFRRLGISALETDGSLKSTHELLLEVADRFRDMRDPAQRAALVVELFGKNALVLLPLLIKGRDGIAELEAEAKRLGLTLTTEQARAAEKFNDNLTRMEAHAKSVGLAIGNELIPPINRLYEALEKLSTTSGGPTWFGKLIESIKLSLGGLGIIALPTREWEIAPPRAPHAFIRGPGVEPAPKEIGGKGEEMLGAELTRQFIAVEHARDVLRSLGEQPSEALVQELGHNKQALDNFIESRRLMKEANEELWEDEKKVLEKSAADEHDAMVSRVSLEIDAMNERIEASKTFFSVYLEDMQKFIGDTQSGFGLARQAAIQTAHAMANGFQEFFFNVMTGQFRSFKDALQGVLTFAQQIISRIMADMATTGLLKGVIPALSSFFAPPAVQGPPSPFVGTTVFAESFQHGGIVTRPGFGYFEGREPEAVVPLSQWPAVAGANGVTVQVIDQRGTGAPVQSSQSRGPDGRTMIRLLIRDAVKDDFNAGYFDRPLATNFGLSRQGASR